MCKKKLVEFEVKEEHYIVYGNYVINHGTFYNFEKKESVNYDYPEFDSLNAKIVKDEKEFDYSPSGTTFAGHKYDVSDMIQDFLAKQIQYSLLYKAVYVEEGLQNLIDSYRSDIALTFNEVPIPKKVLSNDMYDLYELQLVTSEFIYYMDYDRCLMLSVDSHEVVSDNYFALEGFFDSVEKIRTGNPEETLIWGTIPEE